MIAEATAPASGPVVDTLVATLIECVLDAVWVVERQGLRIVAVNEAAVQLLGLAKHELIGRSVTEFTASPEDIYFWEDVAAGHGQTIHSETRMPCGDGQTLQVERRISPMKLGEGGDGYMVCMRDRSQQRHMEDELELVLAE
ncbi:MAG: diguanylate cyclase, partial [Rhodoferax sp.]|nr:diguanylate cyclase [Rhodoferax sp.]